MESAGVIQLYERSIDKHNICYNPFIGDGDSSSYNAVDKLRPYGPMYNIEKSECVNHVTKRMGTILRALLHKYKGLYKTIFHRELEETLLTRLKTCSKS